MEKKEIQTEMLDIAWEKNVGWEKIHVYFLYSPWIRGTSFLSPWQLLLVRIYVADGGPRVF